MESKKLKKLRTQLKGHYSSIARKADVDVSTISRVLNGNINNTSLLSECINYRDAMINEQQQLIERI